MIVLLSLAAWLATVADHPSAASWEATVLIAVFTVVAWRRPDRYGPAVLIALHVVHWVLVGVPSFLALTALGAALVGIHLAAAVSDGLGSLRGVPMSAVRRWARQAVLVIGATPVVLWLAAVRPDDRTAAAVLMGAALLAVTVTAWWLTPREER